MIVEYPLSNAKGEMSWYNWLVVDFAWNYEGWQGLSVATDCGIVFG